MAEQQCVSNSDEKVECLPLKTLEQVLSWKPKAHKFCVEKLHKRIHDKNHPRTLVCHDMKGGYLEDRFVQGVEQEDCFSFIHWSVVDIFVYFSHYLVTIPPCGWITAAHRNGTLILGTFITEWDEGAKICEDILKDIESVHKLCDQLVDIATFYGFDGWLVNIENKIQPHQVEHLEEFVRVLSDKQHAAKSNSQVIWYDSVIKTGELKWQNGLNENNKNFFAGCDGFFVNYTWKEEHLQKTAVEAGSRKTDIYVGVDVFGRGCLGNGGFCTNVAVKAAREYGFSVAIFAPGWIYECLEVKDLWENQYKFWDLLSELCQPLSYKSLPFITSFCPGFGKKMFRKGNVIGPKPWFNLSLQQPQPTYHYMQAAPHGGCASVYTDDAYSGGGCLKLSGAFKKSSQQTFGIFKTCFKLERSCIISYTFKSLLPQNADLTMILNVISSGKTSCLHLVCEEKVGGNDSCFGKPNCSNNIPSDAKVIKYPAAGNELCGSPLESQDSCFEENGWITRTYVLPVSDFNHGVMCCVDACISCPDENIGLPYSVLLGNFLVLPVDEGAVCISCRDVWQTTSNDKILLYCLLEWTPRSSVHSWDLFYNLGDGQIYLGTTSQSFYKVNAVELEQENCASSVKPEIKFSLHGQSITGVPPVTQSVTVYL